MEVKIFYVDGCSCLLPTMTTVKTLANEFNLSVEILPVKVHTAKEAEEINFLGSPTVKINGFELLPEPEENSGIGLT